MNKLEAATRRSLGLRQALARHLKEHPVDLIVVPSIAGAPHMLLGEFGIPVISYIEFPSFKAHGWDPKYPPPESNRLRDINTEMLSWYLAMKSDRVMAPSEYARSMFPPELRDNVSGQPEGFVIPDCDPGDFTIAEDRPVKIGFCARDLSSAKGIEHFLQVAGKLLEARDNIEFVIIGSTKLLYSYETGFLNRELGEGA